MPSRVSPRRNLRSPIADDNMTVAALLNQQPNKRQLLARLGKSKSSVANAVRELINDKSADVALQSLRTTRNGTEARESASALKTAITKTRRLALEIGFLHGEFSKSLGQLQLQVAASKSKACKTWLKAFLAMNLVEAAGYHRNYVKDRADGTNDGNAAAECVRHNKQVDRAFRELRIMPDNVDALVLPVDEAASFKAQEHSALYRKAANIVHIEANELFQVCVDIVRDAAELYCKGQVVDMKKALIKKNKRHAYSGALHAALLLVSGRRLAEISSNESGFRPVHGHAYAAMFSGQLKKRHTPEAPEAYCIPLLIDFKTFQCALHAFHELVPPGSKTGAAYSNAVSKFLSKLTDGNDSEHSTPLIWVDAASTAKGARGFKTAHLLRSVYAKLVFIMFDCASYNHNLVSQFILGHERMTMSALHYSSIHLNDDADFGNTYKDTLGPFPCRQHIEGALAA